MITCLASAALIMDPLVHDKWYTGKKLCYGAIFLKKKTILTRTGLHSKGPQTNMPQNVGSIEGPDQQKYTK